MKKVYKLKNGNTIVVKKLVKWMTHNEVIDYIERHPEYDLLTKEEALGIGIVNFHTWVQPYDLEIRVTSRHTNLGSSNKDFMLHTFVKKRDDIEIGKIYYFPIDKFNTIPVDNTKIGGKIFIDPKSIELKNYTDNKTIIKIGKTCNKFDFICLL